MNERLIVVLIFTAIFLKELFFLLPENVFIRPFPLHNIEITLQSYLYFACSYAGMLIVAYIFSRTLTRFRGVAETWFILQGIEFADYFLTYNTPWCYFGQLPIGITLVKFIVLFSLIIYKLS